MINYPDIQNRCSKAETILTAMFNSWICKTKRCSSLLGNIILRVLTFGGIALKKITAVYTTNVYSTIHTTINVYSFLTTERRMEWPANSASASILNYLWICSFSEIKEFSTYKQNVRGLVMIIFIYVANMQLKKFTLQMEAG